MKLLGEGYVDEYEGEQWEVLEPGTPLPVLIKQEMLGRFKQLRAQHKRKMECYVQIAKEQRRALNTVKTIIVNLQSTKDLAAQYLESQAYRLTKRLVKEARTPEIIDILTRPNVGVLAPHAKESSGGQGFFLSVQAESCGAVKVGIATGQLPGGQHGLPEKVESEVNGADPFDPTDGWYGEGVAQQEREILAVLQNADGEAPGEVLAPATRSHFEPGTYKQSAKALDAIRAARRRLKPSARRRKTPEERQEAEARKARQTEKV
jgi:hypothetical protein